ncbi:hypothetical protein [Pseudomonas sp.]|uniref:hypothetical protein n=1 Tax=Pseudomonas sp. TaxID=306 RepID=UPI003FD8E82A
MNTEQLQSRMRTQVEHLKEQMLGFELMRLAGGKAVEAGEVEGVEMFEAYSWSMGHDIHIMCDAEILGRCWRRTNNAEDFAMFINQGTVFSSKIGRLAAQCLLKHYDGIEVSFGTFKDADLESELSE